VSARAAWLALALVLVLAAGAQAAKPRCYGAAARDPERACTNPRLERTVTPTPDEAAITPNVACARDSADSCAYGVAPEQARETVVMVGDSHAAHWRGALIEVAKRKRWRVIEFARPHCPFSMTPPAATEYGAAECVPYNRSIVEWLAARPQITTVFVSNNARLPMSVRGYAARTDGHAQAIEALPASVQRVLVIRDPPTDRASSHDCVRRAMRGRRAAGRACAVPRRRALVRDAGVAAAQRLHARGARAIDLTDHFCDRRNCFPVVGGVLVHKDVDHLTQQFSATLGTYLRRAVDAAG
jgi:hypothetical protein